MEGPVDEKSERRNCIVAVAGDTNEKVKVGAPSRFMLLFARLIYGRDDSGSVHHANVETLYFMVIPYTQAPICAY